MTKTRAAEILGCSVPNVSKYMRLHFPKHLPENEKRMPPKGLEDVREKGPKLIIKLDDDASNLEWGSAAWKATLQGLTQDILQPDLLVEERVKLVNTLIKMLQFQFKEKDLVPEYQAQEVRLNDQQAEEIIGRILNDHDEWCPYRRDAIKAKAQEQSKIRFLSPESSPLG